MTKESRHLENSKVPEAEISLSFLLTRHHFFHFYYPWREHFQYHKLFLVNHLTFAKSLLSSRSHFLPRFHVFYQCSFPFNSCGLLKFPVIISYTPQPHELAILDNRHLHSSFKIIKAFFTYSFFLDFFRVNYWFLYATNISITRPVIHELFRKNVSNSKILQFRWHVFICTRMCMGNQSFSPVYGLTSYIGFISRTSFFRFPFPAY